ncbi:hypothetical protein [Streptomyces sp. NBC_00691]|nr:hypothetical protein [Streptomyces sp. NBC_00691]
MFIDSVSTWAEDPEYHVLRIDPWRVQVLRGSDLGSRIWTDGARR